MEIDTLLDVLKKDILSELYAKERILMQLDQVRPHRRFKFNSIMCHFIF
jgi:hypothetical protein